MVTLRYLATGHCQQSQSLAFRVGISTLSRLLRETCHTIWLALQGYIKSPSATTDWSRIADEFMESWNFPNCIVAIDGKHVMMGCPNNAGSACYNYKDFYSVVLLARGRHYEKETHYEQRGQWWQCWTDTTTVNRYTFETGRSRDDFMAYFNSPAGEVPWQLQHVRNCGRVRSIWTTWNACNFPFWDLFFFFNYFFGQNKISQILSKGNHNTVLILLDQSRIVSFQL